MYSFEAFSVHGMSNLYLDPSSRGNYIMNGILVRYIADASRAQAFYLVMLPTAILGIIAPIIAKVFIWYGIMPAGHY